MTSKTGNRRGDKQLRKLAGFASALALSSLLAAGCSNTNQGHLTGDPLFGEFGIKQPGPVSPPAPSTPPASKTQASLPPNGLPPIPTAQFSSSPAALAAGPLPGARPLAIDGSGGLATGGNNNIIPASTNGAGLKPIVLPVPRETAPNSLPVVPAAGSGSATSPPGPAWGSPAADPDAAIREQLKARGVLYSKVDTVPEGVRLSVIVPKRGEPDATRVFEATGRDFNSAAQAILQKLQ
jgi:hypothetical protein